MANRIERRNSRPVVAYKAMEKEVNDNKVTIKSLKADVVERDSKVAELEKKSADLTVVMETLQGKITELEETGTKLSEELERTKEHSVSLAKSVLALSQPAQAAEEQGKKEIKAEEEDPLTLTA